jgi:hypothetical protein
VEQEGEHRAQILSGSAPTDQRLAVNRGFGEGQPERYVSDQGRQVGILTRFNDKVVELIVAVPPGTLKPDPKHLDPLVAMLPK